MKTYKIVITKSFMMVVNASNKDTSEQTENEKLFNEYKQNVMYSFNRLNIEERKYLDYKYFNNKLDEEIGTCIQKVGMVRYSAFKDTGSDLSFALALLNDNNNGVVLNGIYSREMSNIYAKQVVNGEAVNKVSEEERKAIEMAVEQKSIKIVKEN